MLRRFSLPSRRRSDLFERRRRLMDHWAAYTGRRESGTEGRAAPPKDLHRSSSPRPISLPRTISGSDHIPLSPTPAHQVQRPRNVSASVALEVMFVQLSFQPPTVSGRGIQGRQV